MNRPKLRFNGFTDDWVQRKLGDLFNVVDTKHATAPITDVKTKYRMIRTDCVRNGQLIVENTDSVTKDIYEQWSERIKLQPGDLVFTREAPMGESAVVPCDDKHYFPGQRIVSLRAKGDVDTLFINNLIYGEEFRKEIYIREAGSSTVANFGIPAIKDYSVMVPSVEEQKKIGCYLNRINNLIALHQRKCDNLKEVKKYMLQKMFPKNGEKVPEIRFAGFTGDWVQRKVIDVAPLQRGFDLPTAEMNPGDYPVVMSNGIGGWHSEYKAKGPGVITGRSGTLGKLHYVEGDYWPHNTSLWVTNFKGNNPKFIYHLYDRLDLSRFGTGSGVPTLNRNDVHDTKVAIPTYEEQKQIADYLDNLDNLISLYQRKCDTLKEVKKYMLQNMFPQGKVGPAVGDDR